MTTTFASLSGPDFLKLSRQQIKALSLDELQLLVLRSQRLLAIALAKPVQFLFEVMPDEYVIEILLVWLDIEDLASFDRALTNHFYRDKYLHLLRVTEHKGVLSVSRDTRRFGDKTIKFGFNNDYDNNMIMIGYEFNCGLVEWLESRKIFMRGLQFCGGRERVHDNRGGFRGHNDIPEGFLVHTGRQLLQISIDKCDRLSDDNLAEILARCPKLQVLSLNFCSSITEVGAQSLALLCSGLHTLNLHGMEATNNWLTLFGEWCNALKKIDLEACDNISDIGICKLAEGCRMLEDVNLGQCGKITDVGVSSLAQFCRNLHTLSLWHGQVTDIGLGRLGEHCKALKNIDLCGTDISDVGLDNLAQGCPGLESVNLSECEGVSDDGVSSLARYCPGLCYLNLAFINEVTDIGLTQLGEHCRFMKELSLDVISDIGRRKIAEGCPSLEVLIIRYSDLRFSSFTP